MSMTIGQLGNGSGYVYVTLADGTTIVANPLNIPTVWQIIQNYANSSASLTDPTLQTDSTFGYRFFGNTTGSAGSLIGSTEITRFIVGRGAQSARYAVSATIATGVVSIDRVSNDMKIIVDTEGGAASDDLDTITVAGYLDNDVITLVGANTAHIVTVKNGTGNIHLTDSVNFSTANRDSQISLRYFTTNPEPGWYEITRASQQPTVARLRANSIAEPVQGVNSTAMGTSGTTTYVPGTDKGYQVITGSPLLIGNIVFTTGGSPIDGDEFILDYRATPTLGGSTVTIFGITLTTTQAAQKCVVRTKYKTSNTTWYSTLYVNGNAIDFATTTQLATKENSLGNPASDGMILSSDISGNRSWVSNLAGTSVLYNTTANNATGADTNKTILKTYTLDGGSMNLDGDLIIIKAIWTTAANGNTKTVGIDFGATTVSTYTAAANADTIRAIVVINRMGGATQSSFGEVRMFVTSSGAATGTDTGNYTLPTENLSADVTINIFGTNGTAAASDIVSKQASVEIYRKQN